MKLFSGLVLSVLSSVAMADLASFDLSIKGAGIDVSKVLELSDVGEGKEKINFDFNDKNGNKYNFDLKYKSLPDNRSFPTNLDITLKDSKGEKLGYLFFAINDVNFLKEMGEFGLVVNVGGEPVNLKFVFDKNLEGHLKNSSLGSERFIQDTLVSNFNFQMIRPVVLPLTEKGVRSKTFSLDSHPYSVNYTLKDLDNGAVQFQYNLYEIKEGNEQLLKRVYFSAKNLNVLREAMFAGKYFHPEDGAFKSVFYPAMGQTEPPIKQKK